MANKPELSPPDGKRLLNNLPSIVSVAEDIKATVVSDVSEKLEVLDVKHPYPIGKGGDKESTNRTHRVTDESEYTEVDQKSRTPRQSFHEETLSMQDAMAHGLDAVAYIHNSIRPTMPTKEERAQYKKEVLANTLKQIEVRVCKS